MTATHTPGSWYTGHTHTECVYSDLASPFPTHALAVTQPDSNDRWEADARLIAAAPDLLQCAKEFRAVCIDAIREGTTDEIDFHEFKRYCDEAIAKALMIPVEAQP